MGSEERTARDSSGSDYFHRVGMAVRFVENHLRDGINLSDMAREACLSPYHFHRVFHAMAKNTPGEYLRRRRLSCAARDLKNTDLRILDIAFDYRFESQEAFTRAFKREFGMNPGAYRKADLPLTGLPPLILSPVRKGGSFMEVNIVYKEAFQVVGKSIVTSLEENKSSLSIPNFWRKFNSENGCAAIKHWKRPGEMLGICADFDGVKFKYIIAAEVTSASDLPAGFEARTVPASRYAVMTVRGKVPDALWKAMDEFYGTWLPASGYQRAEAPDFELYDSRFNDTDKSVMEVYIPLVG